MNCSRLSGLGFHQVAQDRKSTAQKPMALLCLLKVFSAHGAVSLPDQELDSSDAAVLHGHGPGEPLAIPPGRNVRKECMWIEVRIRKLQSMAGHVVSA